MFLLYVTAVDSPQGQEIRVEFFRSLREKMKESISSNLLLLAQTSLLRIAQTLNEEELLVQSGSKRHQDRVALSVLKLVQDREGDVKEVPPLDHEQSERLIRALEAANDASQKSIGDGSAVILDAEIIEEVDVA